MAASEGTPAADRGATRAERDAARRGRDAEAGDARPQRSRRRRGTAERPPPPWGSFPLTELVVLLAVVLGVLGLVVGGERGRTMLLAAVALGSLAGLETAIREHFAGYRSHTTLLSGAAAFAAMIVTIFAPGAGGLAPAFVLLAGALAFAVAFPLFRRAFQRRSGGLSFR